MTSHRIGVNLRVSGNCDQGARKYMEDNHVIKFLKKDTDDYEFAYFGIFDGHGGPDASAFCRDNLLNEITKYDGFWTNDDEQVLSSIRKGFLDTHNAMWNVLDTWPKTVTGLPSTSGSTATIAIIKQGKLYTGHVGDSGLVLGENDQFATTSQAENPTVQAICVTKDHKPDDPDERLRIEDAGGEVINKSGVPRVVWSRPKTNHKGPIRRSTQIDQIPFLAVSRSLGDLWSYDYYTETYVVSPDPDVSVVPLDPTKHRCLILASDGLWNMLTPEESVNMVMALEGQFEERIINDPNVAVSFWSNPAERLVARALNKWRSKALKADNTSCVVVLVDPLGPSKLTLLKRKRQELLSGGEIPASVQANKTPLALSTSMVKAPVPSLGLGEPDQQHTRGADKSRNKNANCSLSDSHIRVTDDSILQAPCAGEESDSACRRRVWGASDRPAFHVGDESINNSVQYQPMDTGHSLNASRGVSTLDRSHRRHHPSQPTIEEEAPFTSLVPPPGKHGRRPHSAVHTRHAMGKGPVDHLIMDEDFADTTNRAMELERESSDSDFGDAGSSIPVPPPCTPCDDSTATKSMRVEGESSLHSSADVTDLAFSLASDESLGTPEPSFEGVRPVTPLSAPAKLNSTRSRRSQISRSAKRKMVVKPGKKACHVPTKPSQRSRAKNPGSPPTFKIPSALLSSPSTLQAAAELSKAVEKFSQKLSKETSTTGANTCDMSTLLGSPPKQVLSTSQAMNDGAATPKNHLKKRGASSGLTPSMSLLMSHHSEETKQLYSLMKTAEEKEEPVCKDGSTTMDAEDLDTNPSEPLKQLNKTTGPMRKSSSRRWGNFLRASKLGLDQIFHKKGSGKLTSLSTSKIETEYNRTSTRMAVSLRNTSVSTSKLGDVTLANLPDVTVSHFSSADMSALNIGDFTNLSALSADESCLMADAVHHSMLEEGTAQGKGAKARKGFLQKTRFTLRRARKAAKKAFFPENAPGTTAGKLMGPTHHTAGGKKRKSDEFLSTPELKRRHVDL